MEVVMVVGREVVNREVTSLAVRSVPIGELCSWDGRVDERELAAFMTNVDICSVQIKSLSSVAPHRFSLLFSELSVCKHNLIPDHPQHPWNFCGIFSSSIL